MGIETHIMMAVFLLTDLVCIFVLKRNLFKHYMKKENGKIQTAAIKSWKAMYYLRLVRYEMIVEYVENGEKKQRSITSVSPFLKKYQNEKYIQIITIPGTDFVFPQEEKWLIHNIELRIVTVILSIGIVLFLLAGFLETWSEGKIYCILFLFFLFLLVYLLVKGCHPYQYRHRTRMKYVTSLSCKDVIERLGKEAKNDFQFRKANRNIEDKMYLLSMNSRTPFYRNSLSEEARYWVLVTPAQNGSAVWFYLSGCRDQYELDRYAEKLRKFMEKKIDAVRTE